MSRAVHVRVFGRFELASRAGEATVTIERDNGGMFSVRPLRARRVYTVPLAHVAERIVRDAIRVEVAERRAAKRKRGARS